MHKKLIQDWEQKSNCKVTYLTTVGSKLFGTSTKTSDSDYKGIFVSTSDDILLKKDPEHWVYSTGNANTKNGGNDVDITLWSLHKFLKLLENGDTGAIDLLFSMGHQESTIVTSVLTKTLYEYRAKFIHKNVSNFVGFAVGQASKYGLKGARYNELSHFLDSLTSYPHKSFDQLLQLNDYKYIQIVMAPGAKGSGVTHNIPYLSVLGKLTDTALPRKYIEERVTNQLKAYGARTIAASYGNDWKALSNAARAASEVIELLQTGEILFPLHTRGYIRDIKQALVPIDEVLKTLEIQLRMVEALRLKSTLPETADTEFIQRILLNTYRTTHETADLHCRWID